MNCILWPLKERVLHLLAGHDRTWLQVTQYLALFTVPEIITLGPMCAAPPVLRYKRPQFFRHFDAWLVGKVFRVSPQFGDVAHRGGGEGRGDYKGTSVPCTATPPPTFVWTSIQLALDTVAALP